VEVYFEPPAAREYENSITIRSNDPERSRVFVTLDGTGVNHAPAPRIQVSPPSLDFGAVPVGGSQMRRISIRNGGEDPLTLTALQAPANFSTPTRSRQIEPGAELSLPVSFGPRGEGEHRGTLTIYSNDPYQRVIAVSLSGAGQGQAVAGSRGVGGVPVGVSDPSQLLAEADPATGGFDPSTTAEAEPERIATPEGLDPDEAEAGPEGIAKPDGLDPGAPEQAPSSEILDGLAGVPGYSEPLLPIHADSVTYDDASGAFAINGLRIPTVDLALGEFLRFDETAVIGRFDSLGEAETMVPMTMYDVYGNPVEMTLVLTTGESTAVVEGDLVSMNGSPRGADGRTALVGFAEFPDRSPFGGGLMRLSLNVYFR
jgi:hypothetical protein